MIGGVGSFPEVEGNLGALEWFTRWLQGVSLTVNHTVKNAALAGTQSSEAHASNWRSRLVWPLLATCLQ